jgi:hypothetical protein
MVQQVAVKRWDPTKFVVVVVGDESAYSSLQKATQDDRSPLFRFPLRKLSFDRTLLLQ